MELLNRPALRSMYIRRGGGGARNADCPTARRASVIAARIYARISQPNANSGVRRSYGLQA